MIYSFGVSFHSDIISIAMWGYIVILEEVWLQDIFWVQFVCLPRSILNFWKGKALKIFYCYKFLLFKSLLGKYYAFFSINLYKEQIWAPNTGISPLHVITNSP